MDNQELKKKLAGGAGFKKHYPQKARWFWIYPDGSEHHKLPNFTESLDACFKWLMPKVREHFINKFAYKRYGKVHEEGAVAQYLFFLRDWAYQLFDPSVKPALALCLAIEKLIDKEGE